MLNPKGRNPVNPHFFATPENEQEVGGRVWTDDEIFEMWEQSAGELRGFQAALQRSAGITADQLGMALQLANAEFNRMRTSRDSHSEVRRCEYSECGVILPPGHTAIYCSNACAHADALS